MALAFVGAATCRSRSATPLRRPPWRCAPALAGARRPAACVRPPARCTRHPRAACAARSAAAGLQHPCRRCRHRPPPNAAAPSPLPCRRAASAPRTAALFGFGKKQKNEEEIWKEEEKEEQYRKQQEVRARVGLGASGASCGATDFTLSSAVALPTSGHFVPKPPEIFPVLCRCWRGGAATAGRQRLWSGGRR